MNITRKDFVTIAASMKARMEQSNNHPEVVKTIRRLAVVLELGNPAFQASRFLRACGFSEEEAHKS